MSGSLRDARERMLQAVCYEAGGIVLMTPLCSELALLEPGSSVVLLAGLSLAVMAWSVVFNAVFDRIELARTGRRASARPPRVRLVHALLFESTAVVVTCPIILVLTDWSFAGALGADVGLSLLYAVYGYAFHRVYDFVRPVGLQPRARTCSPYLPSMPMMWAVSQTFRNVKN